MSSTNFHLTDKEIVKVQVPLATNQQNHPGVLVYNKDRKRMVRQKLDSKTRAMLRGDARAFFEAEWNGKFWVIGRRVPEQLW